MCDLLSCPRIEPQAPDSVSANVAHKVSPWPRITIEVILVNSSDEFDCI